MDLRVEFEAFRRRELRHAVAFAVRAHDRFRLRGGTLRGFRVLFSARGRPSYRSLLSAAARATLLIGSSWKLRMRLVRCWTVMRTASAVNLSWHSWFQPISPRGVSEGDPGAPVVCLGDQVVQAFLAFRGLVELFLDVADELFGLFAGEVAVVRVDAHVDGQVVARVFDDRVACRGLPRFRLRL